MAKSNLGRNLLIGGVVTVAAIGGYNMFSDSDMNVPSFSSVDNTQTSSSNVAYVYSLTDDKENITIDDNGELKEKKLYDVEIPLSAINGSTMTLGMNASVKMLLEEGILSSEDLFKKEISFAFNDDIMLENADGDDVKLIDFDDSTINGEEGSSIVTFDSSNDETVEIKVDLNGASADLFNELDKLEEDGDEYTFDLTKGLENNIQVIIENDING